MAKEQSRARQEKEKRDRANQIRGQRLRLEEELCVIERLELRTQTELKNLPAQCPHMRLKMIDYWEGGSCRIRIRCLDCHLEEPRGGILSLKKRGRTIEDSNPQFFG